jgi:hypothetical protein
MAWSKNVANVSTFDLEIYIHELGELCPESYISDPDLMWPASLGLQTGFEREFQISL